MTGLHSLVLCAQFATCAGEVTATVATCPRAATARAGERLRTVERGDTIEITDRGRPVALLGPIPGGSPLEQLRLAGHIEPARGDLDDLPEPLPSNVLAGLRDSER